MAQASALTQAIITTINSGLGIAWRNNTVGIYDLKTKRYRRSSDRSAIGTGDVVACIDGEYLEFEIKIGSERQSVEQKIHQHRVQEAAGRYFVVKSIDEFIAIAEGRGWINHGIRRKA